MLTRSSPKRKCNRADARPVAPSKRSHKLPPIRDCNHPTKVSLSDILLLTIVGVFEVTFSGRKMPHTFKDIESIEHKPIATPWFGDALVALLRLLAFIPVARRYLLETAGGLLGRIFACSNNEDYEEAARIALRALGKYRHRKSRLLPFMVHHHWWTFMRHGVASARMIEDIEVRKKFIDFANTGIPPLEGYDVAYSFLEFSRWRYCDGDYAEAINYAETASNADSTWAEPDFLLGFYRLVLGIGDAEAYLSRSLDKDKRIIFRIVNNAAFKQHPHLIAKLKAKYAGLED